MLCIYTLRSRVPVSTASSVISYSFHTTPGQTAKNYLRKMWQWHKWHEFGRDLCCKLLCVEAERSRATVGETAEQFFFCTALFSETFLEWKWHSFFFFLIEEAARVKSYLSLKGRHSRLIPIEGKSFDFELLAREIDTSTCWFATVS